MQGPVLGKTVYLFSPSLACIVPSDLHRLSSKGKLSGRSRLISPCLAFKMTDIFSVKLLLSGYDVKSRTVAITLAVLVLLISNSYGSV